MMEHKELTLKNKRKWLYDKISSYEDKIVKLKDHINELHGKINKVNHEIVSKVITFDNMLDFFDFKMNSISTRDSGYYISFYGKVICKLDDRRLYCLIAGNLISLYNGTDDYFNFEKFIKILMKDEERFLLFCTYYRHVRNNGLNISIAGTMIYKNIKSFLTINSPSNVEEYIDNDDYVWIPIDDVKHIDIFNEYKQKINKIYFDIGYEYRNLVEGKDTQISE